MTPADEGEEEDLDVEPPGPVFNIVEVVLRPGGEVGVAAQAVDLGPAGHAGFDDVAGLVVRDLLGEVGDVVRAFGARADEAHVAAEDVPILGEFVEVPAAHEGAEAEEAGVVAGGALLRGVGRGGVGGHAAEFVEREGAVVGADADLAEEDGATGRLAFEEGGEDEDERGGSEEAEGGAGDVAGAFEGAVEEAVDGEFFDAEDGDAADGLEAEAAEKNVEGAGHEFPFDVGAFAGGDEAREFDGREVGAGDNEDVGAGDGELGGEVGGVVEGDEAGEGVGVGGVALEFGDEGGGVVVGAENNGAAADVAEERGVRDDGVGEGAPQEEEGDDADEGDDDEEARDRRVEFEDEGNAEVGDEPEGGALEDGVERLIAAQKEAGVVEAELGEGGEEERDADQEEREVAGEGGVGDGDEEAGAGGGGEGRGVAEPVAEGEAGEGEGGIAREQRERDDGFAEGVGGGAGQRRRNLRSMICEGG